MSVRRDGETLVLAGRCGADDAETLLLALLETPHAVVDLAGVQKLHLAVTQILFALRPAIRGRPEAPFLARNIFDPLISGSDSDPETA